MLFNIFSFAMLLLVFNIEILYIYPRNFSSIRKKQLCLGELCRRVPDVRLSGNLTKNLSHLLHAFNSLGFRWEFNLGDILFKFDVSVIWMVHHRTDASKCLTQLHIVSLFALGLRFCLVSFFAAYSNFYMTYLNICSDNVEFIFTWY